METHTSKRLLSLEGIKHGSSTKIRQIRQYVDEETRLFAFRVRGQRLRKYHSHVFTRLKPVAAELSIKTGNGEIVCFYVTRKMAILVNSY